MDMDKIKAILGASILLLVSVQVNAAVIIEGTFTGIIEKSGNRVYENGQWQNNYNFIPIGTSISGTIKYDSSRAVLGESNSGYSDYFENGNNTWLDISVVIPSPFNYTFEVFDAFHPFSTGGHDRIFVGDADFGHYSDTYDEFRLIEHHITTSSSTSMNNIHAEFSSIWLFGTNDFTSGLTTEQSINIFNTSSLIQNGFGSGDLRYSDTSRTSEDNSMIDGSFRTVIRYSITSINLNTNPDGIWTNIPEPTIIALFALGLVGIGFARRRQS
jgi:hypothetical protein